MEQRTDEREEQGEEERGRGDEPVLRVRFDFYSSHNILRMFECYLDYREEESLKNYSPSFASRFLYDHYRP